MNLERGIALAERGDILFNCGDLAQIEFRQPRKENQLIAELLCVKRLRGGKLERLDWAALRQTPNAPGIDYQLRYLQRVNGEFALPEGFTPTRLIVQLQPAQGKAVETAFNWKDIAGA